MSKRQTGGVQSVDRAISILECVAETRGGARLSAIAQEIGLAVSTVHRLLTTLEGRGFVQLNPQTGAWSIGRRAHAVGESYGLHDRLVAPARRFLRDLRDATRETANLGVIDAEEAVMIAQVESREIMRAISTPGGRAPVLNSGIGKAIIATWPDEAIERLVSRQGLLPLTPNSLSSEQAVFEDIRRIRRQGYALDDEEYVLGMRCVAAVILGPDDEAIAAISVSGLVARVSSDKVPQIADLVCEKAHALSEQIRGP